MAASKVLSLAKPAATMTCVEGLAFIAQTRRQLDRFEDALPHREGATIAPEEEAAIRQMCDALEADIQSSLKLA
jgi:hypothetical protein